MWHRLSRVLCEPASVGTAATAVGQPAEHATKRERRVKGEGRTQEDDGLVRQHPRLEFWADGRVAEAGDGWAQRLVVQVLRARLGDRDRVDDLEVREDDWGEGGGRDARVSRRPRPKLASRRSRKVGLTDARLAVVLLHLDAARQDRQLGRLARVVHARDLLDRELFKRVLDGLGRRLLLVDEAEVERERLRVGRDVVRPVALARRDERQPVHRLCPRAEDGAWGSGSAAALEDGDGSRGTHGRSLRRSRAARWERPTSEWASHKAELGATEEGKEDALHEPSMSLSWSMSNLRGNDG